MRKHATLSLKVKSSWCDNHLLEDVAGSWHRMYAENLVNTLGALWCAKELCIHLADTQTFVMVRGGYSNENRLPRLKTLSLGVLAVLFISHLYLICDASQIDATDSSFK
jgi:hypothetical protein